MADTAKCAKEIRYSYFYGQESEQFTFLRIPKTIFMEEPFLSLSWEARILYSMMLDRMGLSQKNGWFDEKNRVYIIFTLEEVQKVLNCGRDKGMKVLAELDTGKGIGLIERVRQGFSEPNHIYVKNFVVKNSGNNEDNDPCDESEKNNDIDNSAGRKNRRMDVDTRSEKPTYRGRLHQLTEVGKSELNNKENNIKNECANHIYPSGDNEPYQKQGMIDMMDDTNSYISLIKENIEYEHHMKCDNEQDKALFEELFEIICEVVCVKRQTIKIAGEEYPYELVKAKYLKLDESHLEYVIGCMKETCTKITNIKAYMITALYNAPSTMNHYYQQEVRYDMYGGGWEEKGIRI